MIHVTNLLQDKLRYEYPLNENSIVFDVGGYKGEWSEKIYNKYQCKIFIFEPVKKFYNNLVNKFIDSKNILINNYGLSNIFATQEIYLNDDASGLYKISENKEDIKLFPFSYSFSEYKIDLMKVNIEGEEYNLLLDIMGHNCLLNIKNLQIQWHNFNKTHTLLKNRLLIELQKTHYLTYQLGCYWENWRLKNQKYENFIDNFNILANDYESKIEEIKNLKEKIDNLNKKIYNIETKDNKEIAEIKTDKAKLNEVNNNLKTKLHNSKHECDKLKSMYNSSLAEIDHLNELLKIYKKEL
jgi:FkbM family methyltransferase